MKVTVQSKIAELESRVAALEARMDGRQPTAVTYSREEITKWPSGFWKRMDEMFERMEKFFEKG
jgi:tetrahydromethanopterin S-methyltransferase subunit B